MQVLVMYLRRIFLRSWLVSPVTSQLSGQYPMRSVTQVMHQLAQIFNQRQRSSVVAAISVLLQHIDAQLHQSLWVTQSYRSIQAFNAVTYTGVPRPRLMNRWTAGESSPSSQI